MREIVKDGLLGRFNFDFLQDGEKHNTPCYRLYVHNHISVIIITFSGLTENVKYVINNDKFNLKYNPEGGARMSTEVCLRTKNQFNDSEEIITDLKTTANFDSDGPGVKYHECEVDYELFKDSFPLSYDEEEEWRQVIYSNMNIMVRFLRRRRNMKKKEGNE